MKRHALRICSPRSLAVAIRLSLMALSVSRRAALMLAFAGMAHGQATVDIEDTIVSGSPPAPVSGLLVITWSAFVSADSFGINSGRKEILLLPTPAAPSVAQAGTAGAITYYYWVSARTANSESLLSAAGSTATSHATLSVTNYNQITWTGVSGAADYRVWRTTGATAPTGTGSYLVGVATGATINDIRTVSSVTQSTGTIVFSATVTTTTGDLFVLGTAATANNSAYNKEPMGLLGLVDASTYLSTLFSFDRTAAGQTFFQSGVFTSVGVLAEDFVLRKVHNQANVSGKRVNQFFAGTDVLQEYVKLSQPDRRYSSDGKAIAPDVGVPGAGLNEELTFCGIPIAVDKHAPYGHLFGVNTEHLFFATLSDGEWEDPNGTGELLRRQTDKTDYEAVWCAFYNMVSDKGNAHFRMSGITSTVDAGAGIAA